MKLKMLFCFFIVLIIIPPRYIYSQQEKKASDKLIKKIEELEKKVAELEARLDQIENKINSEKNKVTTSSYSKLDYTKKENWRALKQGMSKYQVKELLGEPGKISKNIYSELWYYPDALGGSVSFGSNGALESWSEP